MGKTKVYYFDLRNLAEPIRVILHYLEIPFDDIRVEINDWPSLKEKMPQGTLPVLEIEGKKLCQSHTIMRYLGRVHNLTGRNHFERAVVDSIADLVKDFYNQVSPYYYARLGVKPGDVPELKKTHLIPAAESKLPLFENYLKGANSGYYVKSGLTYVDFIVSEFFDILYTMESSIFSSHPLITEHIHRIHSIPSVKKEMKSFPVLSAVVLLSICITSAFTEDPEAQVQRLRFFPNFSLQFPMEEYNSQRARRANNLANMMRLGKRSSTNRPLRILRNPIHAWMFSGVPQDQSTYLGSNLGY